MDRTNILLSILQPGDKLLWIVGMPGPDTDDMEVLSVEGDRVRIKYQVYGKGPFFEKLISPHSIMWRRDSEFAARLQQATKQSP